MEPSSPPPSRRHVLGQATLAVGVATLSPTVAGAVAPTTKPAPAHPAPAATQPKRAERGEDVIYLKPTGWNVYANRFVDAPTFTWAPFAGAAGYVVQVAVWDQKPARTVRLAEPTYDMADDWAALPPGQIDMLAWPVDADGRELCTARHRRFHKSPGWDGARPEPLDWKASIDRAMAYVLAPAKDEVRDFEQGLPRSCWSCSEDSVTGKRRLLAFPALHHPSFIFAFLAYASAYPEGPLAPEAVRQAKQYGDWLLANRLPADWQCALFPFSSIEMGRTEGYIEGRNITLFRAARVGEAMVAMFRQFSDDRYLIYARHLADKYVERQRADGSWPYRVDPKDGRVVEEYTSNAVTPARLFGLLEAIEPDARYAAAREKAERWVMENPVRTRRWQGMYEDVGASVPFRNLQHWDTNEMIRYLVHFCRDDAERVRVAEELNRYIEDQFVVWREGDSCCLEHCPAVTVLEQYTCFRPMESHTAVWAQSLIALHRATGNDDYLAKAIAGANAIVRGQQSSGAYSTWGFDTRFGRPILTIDWPGCNCVAIHGLLRLDAYLKGLPTSRGEPQPL